MNKILSLALIVLYSCLALWAQEVEPRYVIYVTNEEDAEEPETYVLTDETGILFGREIEYEPLSLLENIFATETIKIDGVEMPIDALQDLGVVIERYEPEDEDGGGSGGAYILMEEEFRAALATAFPYGIDILKSFERPLVVDDTVIYYHYWEFADIYFSKFDIDVYADGWDEEGRAIYRVYFQVDNESWNNPWEAAQEWENTQLPIMEHTRFIIDYLTARGHWGNNPERFMEIRRDVVARAGSVVAAGTEIYFDLVSIALGPFSKGFDLVLTWKDFYEGNYIAGTLGLLGSMNFRSGGEPTVRYKSEGSAESFMNIVPGVQKRLSRIQSRLRNSSVVTKLREFAPAIPECGALERSIILGKIFCFSEDTLVKTPEGQTEIGKLNIGDSVIAYDEVENKYTTSRIININDKVVTQYLTLRFNDGGSVRVTKEHPFLVRDGDTRVWLSAEELKPGSLIVGQVKSAKVDSIEESNEELRVINCEVQRYHTFCIGENGLVAHNKCAKQIIKDAGGNVLSFLRAESITSISRDQFLEVVRSCIVPVQKGSEVVRQTKNLQYISDAIRRLRPGHHEWAPCVNIEYVYGKLESIREIKKYVAIMDSVRIPTKDLLFKGKDKVLYNGTYEYAGHITSGARSTAYSKAFHGALNEAVRNSVTYRAFDVDTWSDLVKNVIKEYCAKDGKETRYYKSIVNGLDKAIQDARSRF